MGVGPVLTYYIVSQSPESVFKMQSPRPSDSGSHSCNLGRIQDLAFFRTCGPHVLGETTDFRTLIFIILRFIVIAFSEAECIWNGDSTKSSTLFN